ncbi:MAG: hypothetical protein HY913_13855 [Desulfomonile tiedjei]|nr:hypothetical protein [Desulfomonile tiedjei]
MSSSRSFFLFLCMVVIAFGQTLATEAMAENRARSKEKAGTVWLVYFFSADCEKCETVKKLIETLKVKYPVQAKMFNIDQKPNQELMQRLQAIHSKDKFAVPLVMVGESVLMGESEISAKLDGLVRKMAKSGGAPVPYLGAVPGRSSKVDSREPCRNCSERGRAPEITDELKRIRGFLERWL